MADATPLDMPVLDALLGATEALSDQELARRCGAPLEAVWQALAALRADGCDIQHHPDAGERLLRTGLGVWRGYLLWRCPLAPPSQTRSPRLVEVYAQTSSTQDVCRRIVEAAGTEADGALAVADVQTAGRGRLGRKWLAPHGACVLFSRVVVAPPDSPRLSVDRLALATAVAVAEALEQAAAPYALEAAIKWPNDLVVAGRKIGGILVEAMPRRKGPAAAIIGLGLNVSLTRQQLPADLAPLADALTSLAIEGCAVDRLRVLATVVERIDHALTLDDVTPLLGQWRRRSVLLGRHATFRHRGRTVRGEVVDLDPYDGLIVRDDRGAVQHLPAETTTVVEER